MNFIKCSDRLPPMHEPGTSPRVYIIRYWRNNNREDDNFLQVNRWTAGFIRDYHKGHVVSGEIEWFDDTVTDQEKELQEWKDECERLSKIADFWQQEYYKINPGFKPPKLDHL